MPWFEAIGCQAPEWQNEMATIIVDYVMLIISFLCLIVTIYGTYRYIKDHRALKTSNIKPTKPLYFGGLIFFIVSSITLLNAMIYDALYLVCPQLDDLEGPIYHSVYFLQIFCLWIVLFLRIYSIFKTSEFELSKITIALYIVAFSVVIITTIPFYMIYELHADSIITLPYVTLSALFSGMLLVTFIHKLVDVFSQFGVDEHLLKTMVKNTVLAVISIACTLVVVIVLVVLYIKHEGNYHDRYSVLEELVLELFILIDIVSNFICVLLSYAFFDQKFQRLCGFVNAKVYDIVSHKIEESATSQLRYIQDKTDTNGGVLTSVSDKHISSKEITISVGKIQKEPEKPVHTRDISKPLTGHVCHALYDTKLCLNLQQHSVPVHMVNVSKPHLKGSHSQPVPQINHY
eukprot:22116_1